MYVIACKTDENWNEYGEPEIVKVLDHGYSSINGGIIVNVFGKKFIYEHKYIYDTKEKAESALARLKNA